MKEQASLTAPRLHQLLNAFHWYQTIDIKGAPTPGRFNHQEFLPHYHLPESLEGRTVLDVGCSDGFFSFEFERRGARTVLAVDANRQDGSLEDLDYSPALKTQALEKYQDGRRPEVQRAREEARREVGAERATTFHVAKALLASRVQHSFLSIYELHELADTYDVVFCGTLSEHLKHPLGALEQLRAVTRDLCIFAACGMILTRPLSSGEVVLAKILEKLALGAGLGSLLMLPDDTVCRYTGHEYHNSFFRCTVPAMEAMLKASGFSHVELKSTFVLTAAPGKEPLSSPHAVFHCYVS